MPRSSSKEPKRQSKYHIEASKVRRFTHVVSVPGAIPFISQQDPAACPAPPSFTTTQDWRVLRATAELIEGYEFLSRLHNEVTIFGSAVSKPASDHYKIARKLGHMLGKAGYTVITGGGPGIMEAANRGAYEAKGVSVGLDIELPTDQRRNKYAAQAIGFHYFFTRKVMLSASAQAYIFFPGGFGTLDEMTEMLTLIQTGKIPNTIPLILIGKDYWDPFLAWVKKVVLQEHGFITKADFSIMRVVDTAEEAFAIVKTTKERPFG